MTSRKDQKVAMIFSQVRPDLLKAAWYYAFSCKRCGNCCRSGRRIGLDGHDAWILKSHDEGMFIGTDKHGSYVVTDKGVCPYLDGNHCSIHEIRPSGCVRFPFLDSNVPGVFQVRTDCPGSMELYQRINEVHETSGIPILDASNRTAMISSIMMKYIHDFGTSDQRRVLKKLKFDNDKLEEDYAMFRNMCQLFILDNFGEMKVIKPEVKPEVKPEAKPEIESEVKPEAENE